MSLPPACTHSGRTSAAREIACPPKKCRTGTPAGGRPPRIMAFYLMVAGNAGIPLALMWFLPELRFALGYLVATAVVLVPTSGGEAHC